MDVLSLGLDDAYEILGLNSDARLPEIKRACQRQKGLIVDNKIIDPRLKTIRRDAFAKIEHAYELLVDDLRRWKYDGKAQQAEAKGAMGEEAVLAVEMDIEYDARSAESRYEARPALKYLHDIDRNVMAGPITAAEEMSPKHESYHLLQRSPKYPVQEDFSDLNSTRPTHHRKWTNESSRRFSHSTSERPRLPRTTFSSDVEESIKKMHRSMGSDYGGSEDEGLYRRPSSRSRSTSRHRSISRNRAHSDAYAPPDATKFVKVRWIVQDSKKCVSCLVLFQPSETLLMDCEHLYCVPCLSKLVQWSLEVEELWPPKCCSMEIPQQIILIHLDEGVKARYKRRLYECFPPTIKCSDRSNVLSLPQSPTLYYKANPELVEVEEISRNTSTQKWSANRDTESKTSRSSTSSRISKDSSIATTITEPDLDKIIPQTSTRPAALMLKPIVKKTQWQRKFYQLPKMAFVFVGKESLHFLGLQTTAWFILVLAAVATAITTTYSLQGPPPDPPPQIGDSNHYSLLSQSIIAVCSLYYLMVPYLRGDEDLPVRALFYICWTMSLASAITAPLIYAREWSKSVWAGFAGALAQVAATAFLFEHIGSYEKKRSKKTKGEAEVTEESDEDEDEGEQAQKYTDAVEEITE
jgi:curved DNA-binding protein CbpA